MVCELYLGEGCAGNGKSKVAVQVQGHESRMCLENGGRPGWREKESEKQRKEKGGEGPGS